MYVKFLQRLFDATSTSRIQGEILMIASHIKHFHTLQFEIVSYNEYHSVYPLLMVGKLLKRTTLSA